MRSCEISDIESDLDYDEVDFMGHDELCSTPYRDNVKGDVCRKKRRELIT